jgi:very-short-patch-repair endonuclease
MRLQNKKQLQCFRKKLRTNGTPAEAALWNILKNKKIDSLKFRRQHSVGNFILDFYCPSLKLCIELDGESHYWQEGMKRDKIKTEFLNKNKIHVLRFENKLVFEDAEYVIDKILLFKSSTTPSSPSANPPLLSATADRRGAIS